ncbi:MAG: ABC transporter permease subunit [Lachnospiraceae bacterium]
MQPAGFFPNWAHGEVCMLGAYVCFMATQVDAIPFWLACVIGIGGAAVISFLNERVAYRRIRNSGSPEYVSDDRSHGTFHDLPEPGKCDMQIQIQAAPKAV